MRKLNLNILVAVCVLMMTLALPAKAVTHYVNPGENIQAAIDDANDGDEIEVAPGTYNEAINFNDKEVRLYSSGGPDVTTINGAGHLHVVQCVSGEGPNTILEGFTITGGNAYGSGGPDFDGGGMLNSGSSPTVTNCIFTGNTADYGGGMYNGYGSYPTVTDCIFQNNTARVWGAGMFNNLSNPTVTNCEFLGNNAGWDGGGMFNELSSPTVIDCNFINNIAAHSGGGMYSKNYSRPTVTNCTFSDNAANGTTTNMGGGGMRNSNSSPTMTNCTFSNNTTARDGGGMYNIAFSSPMLTNCILSNNTADWGGGMYNYDNSSPTLTNCTFSGNSAGTQGGGMNNLNNSKPSLTNCILWGNTPEQIVDQDSPASTTLVFYSDVQGGWPGPPPPPGNIDADPFFVDAAAGDLRLSSSASPCVDAGDNSAPNLQPTDLAGNPRVVDGDQDGTATVDMGAYEFQSRLIHNITQDCWYETIQAAINYSNGGDQIEVGPGRYYEAINFKGKAIRLYSSGGQDVTTIDGTGHYHVVQCVSGEGANTILEGFTITGGNATGTSPDDWGGGMFNIGSSPTVTNCTFSGNSALVGGGMFNANSSPTVTDCTFSGNSAPYGGGMSNYYSSSPTVTNCTFSGNSASYNDGGGMFNWDNSNPTVSDCEFTNNSAYWNGGGMYNWDNSSPTVTDCTFTGNTAGDYGGGMYNDFYSDPTVTNCTFSGNSAGLGGGMCNIVSSPMLTNCILWGNTAMSGLQIYGSAAVAYSDVQGGWGGTGNIDADPCFVDSAAGNLRLQPDSPCIDAGDTTAVSLPLDLDGNPRAIDNPHTPNTGLSVSDSLNVVDMGAYEFQPCRIAGDINCDGVVDFKDLAILAGNWLAGVGD